MDPQKTAFLVFDEKPQNKILSLCFSFDSAFKTIDPQMNFWSLCIFENALKKKAISHQKRNFGRFWQLITFVSAF